MIKKSYWCPDGCGKQLKFKNTKIFEFEEVIRQFGLFFCLKCLNLFVNVNCEEKNKVFKKLNETNLPMGVWKDFFGLQKNLLRLNSNLKDKVINVEDFRSLR